jgi:hypothetical protein
MVSEDSSSPTAEPRVTQWQSEYEAALRETESVALFKRVEVAEAAILTRVEALMDSSGSFAERREIEKALGKLLVLKKKILNFP